MHTKDPPIHDCSQTKIIEHFTTISPHRCAPKFPQTLVVESVNLSDLTGFVITPDEGYTIWITDFEGEEEEEGLD